MKTVQQYWKRSLATVALLAAFNTTDASPLPGASAGSAAPKPPEVIPEAAEIPHAPAVPQRAQVSPPGQMSGGGFGGGGAFGGGDGFGGGGGIGRAAIPRLKESSSANPQLEAKLKGIVLDQAFFDGLPLSEVLKSLNEESRKRDPDKQGINFLINPNPPPAVAFPPTIDPVTGLPTSTTPGETVDLNSVIIKFNMPLRKVTMKDLLDAIVKVADHPIEYSLEDYGVVFSLAPVPYSPAPPGIPLTTCTFKVNTNTFLNGLGSTFGIKVELPSGEGRSAERAHKVQSALRDLFSQLGVPTDSGTSVFYNELTGVVMVRVPTAEFELVQAAMNTLGGVLYPPRTADNPNPTLAN